MSKALKRVDRLWCVVAAAGIGSRMQSEKPKQYLSVAGSTVIEHTLNSLLAIESLHRVVVAYSATDSFWPTLDISRHSAIESCVGGATRGDSVLSALTFIQQKIQDAIRDTSQHTSQERVQDEVLERAEERVEERAEERA
ncbi:MAG: 2-C-methyl-D-erythritol 4-phosphate cytidylyltransferase, partial [Flavobacteriales bacterium]